MNDQKENEVSAEETVAGGAPEEAVSQASEIADAAVAGQEEGGKKKGKKKKKKDEKKDKKKGKKKGKKGREDVDSCDWLFSLRMRSGHRAGFFLRSSPHLSPASRSWGFDARRRAERKG